MEISDVKITEAALSGDKEAFGNLIIRYQGHIYGLAYSILGNWNDAQDTAQETFIRAYKGLGSFRGESQMSTWLYRIAINVCHSMLAKESRYQVSESEEMGMEAHLGAEASAETDFMTDERHALVRRAISQLPRLQADAITLFYLREYRYVGSPRSWIFRWER